MGSCRPDDAGNMLLRVCTVRYDRRPAAKPSKSKTKLLRRRLRRAHHALAQRSGEDRVETKIFTNQPVTPTMRGTWVRPRRAIDDRVPADAFDVRASGACPIDLGQDVPEPAPLVEARMAPTLRTVAIVPARLGDEDGKPVAAPALQDSPAERSTRRVRVAVDANGVDDPRLHQPVDSSELALANPVDWIARQEADVAVMVTRGPRHDDRHVDGFLPGHSRQHRVDRGFVDGA